MRPVHFIHLLLLLALFIASAVLRFHLPTPPSLSWYVIPAGAAVLVVIAHTFSALLPRYPHLLSVPDKKQYKALSLERKVQVAHRARRLFDWLAVEIFLIATMIQAIRRKLREQEDAAMHGASV